MSQIPAGQIPAGWYPDPAAPANAPQQRYWDGQAWTGHTAPAAYGVHHGPASNRVATTPDGVPLAGWWWRVLAYFIDSIVIGVPGFILMIPFQVKAQSRLDGLNRQIENGQNVDWNEFWRVYGDILHDQMLLEIPLLLVTFAYIAIMLRWKGATLGKLAVGLRVRLRESPGPLPWATVLKRVSVYNGLALIPLIVVAIGLWPVAIALVVLIGIFGLLNVLWPLWDSKKQALHDKAAGTNVVKIR